jgi:hypothetical protein
LLFREREPGATAASAALGEAITDLFQNANVRRVDAAFTHARGRPEDERHYLQEIFIMTDDCVGVFLRPSSRADRALVIVTDNTVKLGMVLARARSLMAAVDVLP